MLFFFLLLLYSFFFLFLSLFFFLSFFSLGCFVLFCFVLFCFVLFCFVLFCYLFVSIFNSFFFSFSFFFCLKRFWTSKETLLWLPDTFFTRLLNKDYGNAMDDEGAVGLRNKKKNVYTRKETRKLQNFSRKIEKQKK